jgi:hypothetical protein
VRDPILTALPAKLIGLEEEVRTMRSAARLTASGAMAALHEHRLTLRLVRDVAAQAAPFRDSRPWLDLGPLHTRHRVLRRILRVLRQRVRNRVPRRLGADENVSLRFDPEFAFERARGQQSEPELLHEKRHG